MFSQVIVLVSSVFLVVVFAEHPVNYNQDQERSGSYPPSGWRPAGPNFNLPQKSPSPALPRNLPSKNVDSTYLPTQQKQEPASFKQSFNFQQNGKQFGQVDLSYGVPEKTRQPATGYGAPVESGWENSESKNVKIQPSVELSYGVSEEVSGSGDFQEQEQFKYRFLHPNGPFNQRSTPESRNGIEYQVDLTYGAPQDTLSAPPNQPAVTYGPPVVQTTTEQEELTTTTEIPTTTENSTEQDDGDNKQDDKETDQENVVEKENLKEDVEEANQEQGVYYIYHPSGLLQRVVYSSNDDQTNMAFSAKLKYENVEPIRGPVYTYDPETYVFRKLY